MQWFGSLVGMLLSTFFFWSPTLSVMAFAIYFMRAFREHARRLEEHHQRVEALLERVAGAAESPRARVS
jgi:hypothetical protein